MAFQYAARKQERWRVLSILPDVCKTPVGSSTPPVPYPIMSELASVDAPAGTVFANRNPMVLFNTSMVPTTIGNAPGVGKGLKSNTVGEASWPLDRSTTVRIEGKHVIRNNDQFWMNGKYSPPLSKAERWEGRQQQIADALAKAETLPPGADRDKLEAAANRFAKNNVAVEDAKLAEAVYGGKTPEGWKNLSDDPEVLAKHGLRADHLQEPGSAFRAQVYEPDPDVFGDAMKPTVAFKGTAGGEDWSNNFAQGVNRDSLYYRKAVSIGNRIADTGADVKFAGHSLGGGLASAASGASGLPATTFNSAGLHKATVARYGGVPTPSDISAYRVSGEILTGIQESGFMSTLGLAGAGFLAGGPKGALIAGGGKLLLSALMPNAVGTPHTLSGSGFNPVDRHGMHQVIAGIEEEKQEDQATISEELDTDDPGEP